MTPDVIRELSQESGELSEFHEKMLRESRDLIKLSRSKMAGEYGDWDHQDEVYRGERIPDNDDKEQNYQGKPIKMVVPNTFAQVMSFTSFMFLLFKQNPRFYELVSKGGKDYGQKKDDCETLLERDLSHNQLSTMLFQHLLDVGRFGPSIMECSWTRKTSRIFAPIEPTYATVSGVEVPVRAGSEWQEIITYEGNLVRNVSPYRWFPDTRHPLVDFRKGEFCGAEEEYSRADLHALEAAGEVAGVDYIQPLNQDFSTNRGAISRLGFEINDRYFADFQRGVRHAPVVVTKLQRWIVPSKYKFGSPERRLGPEEFPILYHVWYANDNRLIRCEPCMWWHNEFSWTLAQFTPDMHRTITLGLADLVYRLQDVISWFVNSHITSVRRVMNNRLIVDPRVVETKTLDGEGDIYLRKGMSVPVERAVGQLKVQDVTAGHMADMQVLSQLMQIVTGVNDNAMGQYNSGRRSATEARVVTSGAAGRMKMHAHLIWESSLSRLGKMMLSNLRQSLSMDAFNEELDAVDDPTRYEMFRGTPREVARGTDFLVFDSTTASEKGFIAQTLGELFQVILSTSPMSAQRLGMTFDPMKMLEEIQLLRGAGNPARFMLSPEEQQLQMQMMMVQQQVGGQQNAAA